MGMPEAFTPVVRAQDVPPGKMKCVRAMGKVLLIANVGGRFYATDDTCTHEDASLSSGALKGDLVRCPLHGSRFNVRTGEVLEEPAEDDLKTYAVRVEGDTVLVALDEL